MSVNLKMDGNTYQNATKINVGGKTIDIEETGGGSGVVGKYGKYKSVVFTPTDYGPETDRQAIVYDFGEDGVPDLVMIHTGTSDAGYVRDIVLDKTSECGVAIGINKSTSAITRTAYNISESATTPGNAAVFYSGSVMKIGRASTNVTFRDTDVYTADCYWEV